MMLFQRARAEGVAAQYLAYAFVLSHAENAAG